MTRRHVVLVLRYTQVGNALSLVGANMVAVPLEDIIEPLAYTSLADNLVMPLPLLEFDMEACPTGGRRRPVLYRQLCHHVHPSIHPISSVTRAFHHAMPCIPPIVQ